MLLFQGILSLLRRSLGKIFQSIFGWAVHVLFGAVRSEEKTLLSAVVGAAAVWPVLLVGSVFSRVAAFVVAFVPLPKSTPDGLIRAGWIVLAAAVPVFVGYVVGRRSGRKFSAKGSLSGFPITLGLAAGFLVAAFAVPIQKLTAMIQGEKSDHVPLIVEEDARVGVAGALLASLEAAGHSLREGEPPWLARTISAILGVMAKVAGEQAAAPPRYFRSARLEITLYPNGIDLRGRPAVIAGVRVLVAERATGLPALQTTDPDAQKLEERIREAWPAAAREGMTSATERRLVRLGRELALLDCDYEQREIVYRELLQLQLAARGEPQLLASVVRTGRSAFRTPTRTRTDRSRFETARRLARQAGGATRRRALAKTTDTAATVVRRIAGRAVAALLRGGLARLGR